MEKTWIDDEGRLRVDHDENYQMVTSFSVDEIWHLTDSWDIKLAGRLIVLGFNMDYKSVIEYGLKECPYGTTGNDRANILITIMDRFFLLAKSAIAIGRIKEHDTPANWMMWAKSKGYSVAHLTTEELPSMQSDTIPAKAEPTRGEPKKVIQRAFADLHFDYSQWGRYLGDVPKWLKPCRVSRGSKGKRVSHSWNPVLIGIALMDKGVTKKQLNLVFMDLKDWKDEWQETTDGLH